MGWVASGVQVTVDWHVFAGDRWMIEAVPVGRTAPVNAYVTTERMAPVEYRHQASECRGECRLPCGHALTYGCDCDTIAAEAAQGDDDDAYELLPTITPATLAETGVSVDVSCYWGCGGVPDLVWRENGYGATAFACDRHAHLVPDEYRVGEWKSAPDARPVVRPSLRLTCSACGDERPDADVMGAGVSRDAACGFVGCTGTYQD